MNPILYGILFPWVAVVIIFLPITYSYYSKLVKLNNKKIKKGQVSKKSLINGNLIIGLLVVLISSIMAIYSSFDFILKDYKTVVGVFKVEHRAYKQFFAFEESFKVNGNVETYDHLGSVHLKEGQKYAITYARRTNMIIEIKEK